MCLNPPTLRLERNRPYERAHRGDLRFAHHLQFTLTYVDRARTHVHGPIDVAMNLRENLTLPGHPRRSSRTDRPTDVIQRQRLTPSCKTIRLRSHCWGSHYLTLSIGGNDLRHEDKHTRPLSSRICCRGFPHERVRDAAKWRNGLTTRHFPHGLPGDTNTRVFFSPRKSCKHLRCWRQSRSR